VAKYIIFFIIISTLLGACVDTDKQLNEIPSTDLPLLHIQPLEFHLGDIKEGEAAIATFLVRNNNNKAVTLVDIQTSCGCTAAEPDSYIIQPGGFTQLKVAVDTTAKEFDIKKSIYIADSLGNKASAILTFNVVDNPHRMTTGKVQGIFDGACASCHFTPLLNKTLGAKMYEVGCAMCHGVDAEGAYAPSLRGHTSLANLKHTIAEGVGRPQMPGFAIERGGPLHQEQIDVLAKWLISLPALK